MAMTELDKKLMAMSPKERKEALEFISSQMGYSEEAAKKVIAIRKKKITELRDIANRLSKIEHSIDNFFHASKKE